MKYKFIFDLDGTITKDETLPLIAKNFGLREQIDELTKETIAGNIPFVESFIHRVNVLKRINPIEIDALLSNVSLNEKLVDFISSYSQNCVVATGNCDAWIASLGLKIGCEVRSSITKIEDNDLKLVKILKKEDVVIEYQEKGYYVIYVGDGNNDAEAMRIADFSIASGIVHMPSKSVLSVTDFLVFNELSLVSILNNIIKPSEIGHTVVLSCAGVGSRIGLGVTKVLLKFANSTILNLHLRNFCNVKDLRIVVGYQSQMVISETLKHRDDVIFVFNHDYFHTKTGKSYYLGSRFANKHVIEWDGDLVVNPLCINDLLLSTTEYAACTDISSDDPVCVEVEFGIVSNFTKNLTTTSFEWTGPCMLHRDHIFDCNDNVYNIIEQCSNIKAIKIEAYDIDTYEDYLRVSTIYKDWK